ncbi:MAG: DUF1573 domain-containing protein [Candidatus Omnitrophota bacterium]|nr:DUF1573 domain-containing protein [Candidatus Omnitrophota bacterium]
MRLYRKISVIILSFFCLTFFSRMGFAQTAADLKAEIYPKLRDKRCTTMTLDKCDCPDAREMKAYIEALIETGISKEEIFYKVAKKFTLNTILDAQIKQDLEKRLVKETGEKRPQIVLEAASFNFGKVSKKQGKLTKNIKLFNRGNSDLAIKNIKVSCACVTAALTVNKNKSPYFNTQGAPAGWQMVIGPDKSGELEIILDLGHSSIPLGKVTRDVLITSNDPLNSESTLRIEAEVSG